jgi:hypothetical protein
MPIGAIASIGSAVIGAGASIYGANKAKKASDKALAAQQANIDKVWTNVNPWLTAGSGALGRISDPSKVMQNFQESPDYQFRLGQGLNAVTTNRAVNGLLRSGSALKAVTGYASNLASGEFGNWWNRQTGLATGGLEANRIGAGLAESQNQNIGVNAANAGGAAISNGNTIGQLGGSLADIIARYGGGGGNSAPVGGSSSFGGSTQLEGLY